MKSQGLVCAIATGGFAGRGIMSSLTRNQLPGARSVGALKAHVTAHAATGNLYFSTTLNAIVDQGIRWPLGFVYNSLSKTAWHWAGFETVTLTGAVNTAGSSVSLMRDDGTPIVYQYDAAHQTYTFLDPDQGLLTLTYQADKTWRHSNTLMGRDDSL